MNTPLVLLVAFVALGIHNGFAADKGKSDRSAVPALSPPSVNPLVVRLRFVPGSVPKKGASWTELGQGPKKGVLWCQADAGIGDKFPVAREGVKLFEVLLAAGDDDHVVLEIRSKEGLKKIDLARDKAGAVEVGGLKYELLYPSIEVDAAGHEKPPTTSEAMLIITHRL